MLFTTATSSRILLHMGHLTARDWTGVQTRLHKPSFKLTLASMFSVFSAGRLQAASPSGYNQVLPHARKDPAGGNFSAEISVNLGGFSRGPGQVLVH